MKRLALTVAAGLLAVSARAGELGNPDPVSRQEIAAVQAAVEETKPLLPADQKRVVEMGLRFVVSDREPLTSQALGFAPEDDPDYKYPDRTLYPAGTIKVNITRRTAEALLAADRPGVPDGVRETIHGLFFRIVVHEIEHVEEYMDKPVLALDNASECPEGLCDPARLADTKLKTEYEFRALRRDFKEARSKQGQAGYLAAAAYFDAHPELLTQRIKDLPKRLRLAAEESREVISPLHRTLYESAYKVPLLGREYLLGLKALRSMERGARAAGAASSRPSFDGARIPSGVQPPPETTPTERSLRAELEQKKEQVRYYFDFDCGKNVLGAKNILRSDYTYVVPVFKAVLGSADCK